MRLHLIRHPKPLIESGICYGRLDCPAEDVPSVADTLLAELPQGLPVWTSPLRRCHELATYLHARPMIDDRLAEMHFGEWEGRRWDDIPRAELDAFHDDVDALRDDVERIAAKIARLRRERGLDA